MCVLSSTSDTTSGVSDPSNLAPWLANGFTGKDELASGCAYQSNDGSTRKRDGGSCKASDDPSWEPVDPFWESRISGGTKSRRREVLRTLRNSMSSWQNPCELNSFVLCCDGGFDPSNPVNVLGCVFFLGLVDCLTRNPDARVYCCTAVQLGVRNTAFPAMIGQICIQAASDAEAPGWDPKH